jgi:hypothetical protein
MQYACAILSSVARYKLDSVGVQEVRWDKGGTVRAGDYNFFYGKGNENHRLVICTPYPILCGWSNREE